MEQYGGYVRHHWGYVVHHGGYKGHHEGYMGHHWRFIGHFGIIRGHIMLGSSCDFLWTFFNGPFVKFLLLLYILISEFEVLKSHKPFLTP